MVVLIALPAPLRLALFAHDCFICHSERTPVSRLQ